MFNRVRRVLMALFDRRAVGRRVCEGWKMYRVGALGSGLPFVACLAMYFVIQNFEVAVGFWWLGFAVACGVEGFLVHGEKGAVSIKKTPVGAMWTLYGPFGLIAVTAVSHDVMGIVRTHVGMSVFFLLLGATFFVVAIAEDVERSLNELEGT